MIGYTPNHISLHGTIRKVEVYAGMEQRINELEIRYMQQEQTILELNDIVCRQELILEQLQRDFGMLKEQFMAMSPSVSCDPDQEEPPPHY